MMEEKEMEILSKEGHYEGQKLQGKLEETHISWVILTAKWAFKIKKPLKLPFLDFSTLPRRKYYCEQELKLNRRFSSIYLDVLSVTRQGGQWYIGESEKKVVDYAVRMKRLQSAKRMDLMLQKQKVNTAHIRSLAKEVAAFHTNAEKISKSFDLKTAQDLFNDIEEVLPYVRRELGKPFVNQITESMEWSNGFLEKNQSRMKERAGMGYIRDVHGDLHSGNIFLYHRPVLFDCIEFNDQFRKIDVLYEVAFLCMDLEAYEEAGLSEIFLRSYQQVVDCMDKQEDGAIFIYYKCLRANVRAKVHAMSAQQEQEEGHVKEAEGHLKEVRKYLELMRKYREER